MVENKWKFVGKNQSSRIGIKYSWIKMVQSLQVEWETKGDFREGKIQ